MFVCLFVRPLLIVWVGCWGQLGLVEANSRRRRRRRRRNRRRRSAAPVRPVVASPPLLRLVLTQLLFSLFLRAPATCKVPSVPGPGPSPPTPAAPTQALLKPVTIALLSADLNPR